MPLWNYLTVTYGNLETAFCCSTTNIKFFSKTTSTVLRTILQSFQGMKKWSYGENLSPSKITKNVCCWKVWNCNKTVVRHVILTSGYFFSTLGQFPIFDRITKTTNPKCIDCCPKNTKVPFSHRCCLGLGLSRDLSLCLTWCMSLLVGISVCLCLCLRLWPLCMRDHAPCLHTNSTVYVVNFVF
jgi:hypothetical protein